MLIPFKIPADLILTFQDGSQLLLPLSLKLTYVAGTGGCGFWDYLFFFYFYSFIGWTIESLYCTIGESRKSGKFHWVNRGFLAGPICPIYGTGGLVFSVLVTPLKAKLPVYAVIPLAMLFADIVEYLTSFLMEKLFHARWWDYTGRFLNLKGRICFKHTIYWGIAAFIFLYIVHPVNLGFYSHISVIQRDIILTAASVVFATDLVMTVRAALDIQKFMVKLHKLSNALGVTPGRIKGSVKETFEQKFGELRGKATSQGKKMTAWTAERSNQLDELKGQFDSLHKVRSARNSRINRLMTTFDYLGTGAKKSLSSIEDILGEIKERLSDSDDEMY